MVIKIGMRCFLIVVLFVSFTSCEVVSNMDKRIYELKAENEVLRGRISDLEFQADELIIEIDSLNSKIDDVTIEDYENGMSDVHSKLRDVDDQINELKMNCKLNY